MAKQFTVDVFRLMIIKRPLLTGECSVNQLVQNVLGAQVKANEIEKTHQVRWLIGKPEQRDDWLRFNFDKTSITNIGTFDQTRQDFVKRHDNDAVYTSVYIDTDRQVVGIVRNSSLSPSTKSLADKLSRVMLEKCGYNFIADITISPILETEELIKVVDDAYAVTTIGFESSPPNPWDNDDFSERVQNQVGKICGEKGKVVFVGKDLNKDIVKSTIRNERALGHDVYVRVMEAEKTRTVLKRLGEIVHMAIPEKIEFGKVCERLRRKYLKVRGEHKNGDGS